MIRTAERNGGIIRLELSRTDARNAVSTAMWQALEQAIETLDFTQVRTVVVASAVPGIFCPGADIKEFPSLRESAVRRTQMRKAMQQAISALENIPVPVIAEIDGPCVGAGVSIAMACDLRIASARARFGVTPAKLGLIYSSGDLRRLRTVIGSAKAKWLLFTGKLVDAEEARRLGLINQLVEPDALEGIVAEFTRKITANAAATHCSVKTILRQLDEGKQPADNAVAFENAFVKAEATDRIDAMLRKFDAK